MFSDIKIRNILYFRIDFLLCRVTNIKINERKEKSFLINFLRFKKYDNN